jgi:hypothetical protein
MHPGPISFFVLTATSLALSTDAVILTLLYRVPLCRNREIAKLRFEVKNSMPFVEIIAHTFYSICDFKCIWCMRRSKTTNHAKSFPVCLSGLLGVQQTSKFSVPAESLEYCLSAINRYALIKLGIYPKTNF